MNIKRQLTLRFVLHSVIAGLVVLLIAACTLWWVMQRMNDVKLQNNFYSVGLERLVESSQFGEDGVIFDPELLEQVKKNHGWLQSLNEVGEVEQSYNTPSDVPKQYAPGELIAYWQGQKEFPYGLYLWIQEKNGVLYTLLYGVPKTLEPLLKSITESNPRYSDGRLLLPEGIADRMYAKKGYVQLINNSGAEVASFNRPLSVPDHYNVQELALRTEYGDRYGYDVSSAYDEETSLTWVIGLPLNANIYSAQEFFVSAETRITWSGVGIMLTATLLIFALLSFLNAHRFGSPMLHMLAWLDSLGKSSFKEPANRKGQPRSRMKSGKWRRRYRVFGDVMLSIDKLSDSLQREQENRRQMEILREEWISGITHDLKTPLSSIKGYAHLLAEEEYEWSASEVRKFSAIMLEKSAHIDTLISDLAISYRIRSGITPPLAEEMELNGWLANALDQAAANPAYGEGRIIYQGVTNEIRVHLYTPWLERVVNNLTANALLHNSPETKLTVTLTGSTGKGVMIHFSDNGQGMDQRTVSNLFERYYRGGNTSASTDGSGLGLAVSKGLIEAMGGRIVVKSSLGKGTSIWLIWDQNSQNG
ncbi:sensor histidine kinase [Paenibacillus sp. GCM10012306]|uniref:sensor histidine kinase n=1 Tax=Paenibacillus sp. GCM10012306 TaxID=3317342 RepID=UPI003609A28D